jgi:hypothetical protein
MFFLLTSYTRSQRLKSTNSEFDIILNGHGTYSLAIWKESRLRENELLKTMSGPPMFQWEVMGEGENGILSFIICNLQSASIMMIISSRIKWAEHVERLSVRDEKLMCDFSQEMKGR